MIEHHEILILYDFRMVFGAKWAMTIYWCWCHTRVPFTAGLSIFIICARTKQQQQNVPPEDKKGSEICISDQGWEVTRNNCEIRFFPAKRENPLSQASNTGPKICIFNLWLRNHGADKRITQNYFSKTWGIRSKLDYLLTYSVTIHLNQTKFPFICHFFFCQASNIHFFDVRRSTSL